MDGGVQFDPAETAYRAPEPGARVYVGVSVFVDASGNRCLESISWPGPPPRAPGPLGTAGEDVGLAAPAARNEGVGGGSEVPSAGADALLGGGALLRGIAPPMDEDVELDVLLGSP